MLHIDTTIDPCSFLCPSPSGEPSELHQQWLQSGPLAACRSSQTAHRLNALQEDHVKTKAIQCMQCFCLMCFNAASSSVRKKLHFKKLRPSLGSEADPPILSRPKLITVTICHNRCSSNCPIDFQHLLQVFSLHWGRVQHEQLTNSDGILLQAQVLCHPVPMLH